MVVRSMRKERENASTVPIHQRNTRAQSRTYSFIHSFFMLEAVHSHISSLPRLLHAGVSLPARPHRERSTIAADPAVPLNQTQKNAPFQPRGKVLMMDTLKQMMLAMAVVSLLPGLTRCEARCKSARFSWRRPRLLWRTFPLVFTRSYALFLLL